MTSSINDIVNSLQDSQKALIILAVRGGGKLKLESIFKEDMAPDFYLVFPPNVLPDHIDFNTNHPLSINQNDKTISLNTSIIEQKGDRTLHLRAKNLLDPASLREYFRVNTATAITASYTTGSQNTKTNSWTIEGHTQDLSGSGALALFLDEPANLNHIHLEILLPDKKSTIHATAHVVRKKRLRNKRWQISFHFDNIAPKHQDAIITYLLSEQRKQLREKVQAWD